VIGASRESAAAARENLSALTDRPAADTGTLADELNAVTGLLDHQAALRRTLADPSREGQDKAALVARLLDGKVGSDTVDLVSGMVRSRWTQSRDLADTTEQLAALTELIGAERADQLDDVEDELFRFGRVVAGSPELRSALTDSAAPADSRTALVRRLLGDRAKPGTVRLVESLVANPRGRSLEGGLDQFMRLAAERRDRVVALVTTAVPLTEAQRDRLGASLGRLHGRRVHINADVDPRVLGGVLVQIGDELIDGTVAGRLDGARQGLAG
jgi:F-type H+-transporting ATPase subunit delta